MKILTPWNIYARSLWTSIIMHEWRRRIQIKKKGKIFLIWSKIQNKLHFLIIRCEVFLALHEKTFELNSPMVKVSGQRKQRKWGYQPASIHSASSAPPWVPKLQRWLRPGPVLKGFTAPQGHTLKHGHFKTNVVNALGTMGAQESPVRPGGWGSYQVRGVWTLPSCSCPQAWKEQLLWSQGDLGSKPGFSLTNRVEHQKVTHPPWASGFSSVKCDTGVCKAL